MSATLAGLKAGDRVIVHAGASGDASVATVSRTTATRIYITRKAYAGQPTTEIAFNARTGVEVGAGGQWRAPMIEAATPDTIAAVEANQNRRALEVKFGKIDPRRLSTSALERICAIADGSDAALALLERVLAGIRDTDHDEHFDGEQIEADVAAYIEKAKR